MNILITDGISAEGEKILTDAGHTVHQQSLKPDELIARIGEYDCIIVRSATKVTREVIDAGKRLKVIARGGVEGIDAADGLEVLRIALENASGVTVVVAVVNHLNEHGLRDAVGLHEFEQRFGRGVARGRMGPAGEGKLRIVLTDVNVRIDDPVLFGGDGSHGNGSQEASAGRIRPG